jgi:hypothetical protein
MRKRVNVEAAAKKPRVSFGLLFKTDGSIQMINRRGNRIWPRAGKLSSMPKASAMPIFPSRSGGGAGGAEYEWIPYPPPLQGGFWRRKS